MTSINAKHLREFLVLSKAGNLTAAAKTLYISPQGLSKTIGKMENDLGVKLFYRTKQGLILTPEGAVLQKKAIHIIEELESINGDLLRNAGSTVANLEEKKRVYLEMTNGEIEYFGLDRIQMFMDANPSIEVVVNECSDHEIQKHILDGEVDIGLCEGPINNNLYHGTFLHYCRHCLVINKSNPLSRRKSLTFKDLKGENLIFNSKAFAAYNNNMNRCLKAGFTPQIAYHSANLENAHLMASRGMGIVISVEDVVEKQHLTEIFDNLVVVPFAEGEDCCIEIYMITKKNGAVKPETLLLGDYIASWASTL